VGQCFWCGGESGEVLLLGKLPKDAEAPRKMVVNYEPCAICKAQFDRGVVIIEVDLSSNLPNPEIVEGFSPTGRLAVVSREGIGSQIQPQSMVDTLLKTGKALMNREAWGKMFGHMTEEEINGPGH
jgi:hypothetical protein